MVEFFDTPLTFEYMVKLNTKIVNLVVAGMGFVFPVRSKGKTDVYKRQEEKLSHFSVHLTVARRGLWETFLVNFSHTQVSS